MSDLLIGLLGALLSTNQVTAASNLVAQSTGVHLAVVDPNDPVEVEYKRIMEEDDDAHTEVDKWIRENNAFAEKGASIPATTLNARIEQRFDSVVKRYEEFILHHPDHARIRLAYGSFLNDTGKDYEAVVQWEKARELNPSDPAAWNNLADYYSHRGPVAKAFEYLAKAIELNPKEPVYYHNLAIIVFLFRKDSQEIYHLADERQVFLRALELYHKARELDPENFSLATDLAQTYYYLKPQPLSDPKAAAEAREKLHQEAMNAWLEAQKIAKTDVQRQGVSIHFARLCIGEGKFDEARKYLAEVKDPELETLRARVLRNVERKEKGAQEDPDEPAAPKSSATAVPKTSGGVEPKSDKVADSKSQP